jgi:Peptidase_C39 like family
MHLRRRRAVYARRRSGRRRLPLFGGIFALAVGAACWAPLAPTVLAPSIAGDAAVAPVAQAGLAAAIARPGGPALAVPVAAVVPIPTPAARVAPTAVVVPTLSPTGLALLASIKSDRTAQWVKNHAETPLRSGPDENSIVFTRLPQWSTLKQIDSRPDWLLVDYGGDGATREPGPGWVKASDVGGVDPPTVWLRTSRSGAVWSTPDAAAKRVVDVPTAVLMEAIGPDYVGGTRVHVRLPGDGRSVPPTQGWMDGDVLSRARAPSTFDLPWAYPADLRADVRISVPYRTQLDGSDYAGANCGPTVLGMALESFGMNLAPPDLRGQVLTSEDFDPTDTDAGSYIWALARVAQAYGLRTHGLYEGSDGSELHRWSLDELRDSVRQNRPVIVQVYYRALPGREDSGYYGDHYIVLTGLMGDDFLYNDPIGGAAAHEGPGYDRLMSPAQLGRAMRASDTGYQYSAFALSRS